MSEVFDSFLCHRCIEDCDVIATMTFFLQACHVRPTSTTAYQRPVTVESASTEITASPAIVILDTLVESVRRRSTSVSPTPASLEVRICASILKGLYIVIWTARRCVWITRCTDDIVRVAGDEWIPVAGCRLQWRFKNGQ